jgi:flagellin-like hook-associated protein FlgL
MSALNGLASTLTQNVASVQKEIVQVQTQLSSGKKTLNAAEVGIVTRLSAQVSGYEAVSANVTQSLDLLAVTETALGSTTTILSQMKDIATQAANAGLTVSDRTALNATFAQLSVHVGNLLKGATVNNTNLLGSAAFINDAAVSTGDQVIQTGLTSSNSTTILSANLNTAVPAAVLTAIDLVVTNYGVPGVGVGSEAAARLALAAAVDTAASNGNLNIASLALSLTGDTTAEGQARASCAIDILTTALNTISNKQSIVSAEQTGLKELSKSALSMASNLQSTVDSIQNVDETELQTKLQQLNNRQSIDYYLISQMNTAAAAILTIFR